MASLGGASEGIAGILIELRCRQRRRCLQAPNAPRRSAHPRATQCSAMTRPPTQPLRRLASLHPSLVHPLRLACFRRRRRHASRRTLRSRRTTTASLGSRQTMATSSTPPPLSTTRSPSLRDARPLPSHLHRHRRCRLRRTRAPPPCQPLIRDLRTGCGHRHSRLRAPRPAPHRRVATQRRHPSPASRRPPGRPKPPRATLPLPLRRRSASALPSALPSTRPSQPWSVTCASSQTGWRRHIISTGRVTNTRAMWDGRQLPMVRAFTCRVRLRKARRLALAPKRSHAPTALRSPLEPLPPSARAPLTHDRRGLRRRRTKRVCSPSAASSAPAAAATRTGRRSVCTWCPSSSSSESETLTEYGRRSTAACHARAGDSRPDPWRCERFSSVR